MGCVCWGWGGETNGTGSKSPGSVVKGLAWQAGEDVKLVGQEILNDWVESRYFLAVKGIFFCRTSSQEEVIWEHKRERKEYQTQT